MPWLLLTLTSIILWGFNDILLQKSMNQPDPLSHYKTFVCIGIVMAPLGGIMALCSDTVLDSIRMLGDNLYLLPLCIFYAVALFFGLFGAKHLNASVVSPLENIDGAIASIILYFYFLFSGSSNITNKVSVVNIIGTIVIVIGVVLLGIQEHELSKQDINITIDKKKHRLGALALIFPLVYNIVDAISMVAMGITVSGETEFSIPDIDFFFFESVVFAGIAILIWLYMLIVKKIMYNPFKKTELSRLGAGSCESIGTMTFTFAVGINPILTAPISSAYCLVTMILARIFLKERLTKKQYLCIMLLIVGIAMLALSEIFG